MQVNVNGMWTEVPETQVPITVPWDASLSANPQALGDNRGCPPGYFCEYVGETDITGFTIPGGATVRVCRRFDQQIGTNPAVLASETAPGWQDQATINIANAAQAVVAAATPLALSGTMLLVLGAVAFLLLSRR